MLHKQRESDLNRRRMRYTIQRTTVKGDGTQQYGARHRNEQRDKRSSDLTLSRTSHQEHPSSRFQEGRRRKRLRIQQGSLSCQQRGNSSFRSRTAILWLFQVWSVLTSASPLSSDELSPFAIDWTPETVLVLGDHEIDGNVIPGQNVRLHPTVTRLQSTCHAPVDGITTRFVGGNIQNIADEMLPSNLQPSDILYDCVRTGKSLLYDDGQDPQWYQWAIACGLGPVDETDRIHGNSIYQCRAWRTAYRPDAIGRPTLWSEASAPITCDDLIQGHCLETAAPAAPTERRHRHLRRHSNYVVLDPSSTEAPYDQATFPPREPSKGTCLFEEACHFGETLCSIFPEGFIDEFFSGDSDLDDTTQERDDGANHSTDVPKNLNVRIYPPTFQIGNRLHIFGQVGDEDIQGPPRIYEGNEDTYDITSTTMCALVAELKTCAKADSDISGETSSGITTTVLDQELLPAFLRVPEEAALINSPIPFLDCVNEVTRGMNRKGTITQEVRQVIMTMAKEALEARSTTALEEKAREEAQPADPTQKVDQTNETISKGPASVDPAPHTNETINNGPTLSGNESATVKPGDGSLRGRGHPIHSSYPVLNENTRHKKGPGSTTIAVVGRGGVVPLRQWHVNRPTSYHGSPHYHRKYPPNHNVIQHSYRHGIRGYPSKSGKGPKGKSSPSRHSGSGPGYPKSRKSKSSKRAQ